MKSVQYAWQTKMIPQAEHCNPNTVHEQISHGVCQSMVCLFCHMPNLQVNQLSSDIRFQYLAKIDSMTIDHVLITSLGERWRLEMDTFHFQCGRPQLLSENMASIYGLPIDEPPMIGKTIYSTYQTKQICMNLLDMEPLPKRDSDNQRLKFTQLKKNLGNEKKERSHTKQQLKCTTPEHIYFVWQGQNFHNSMVHAVASPEFSFGWGR